MGTASSLLVSPFAWAVYGAAGQMSLVCAVRRPRTWNWLLPLAATGVCLLAALPTAAGGSPDAFKIGAGYGLFMAAAMTAGAAPARMDEGVLLSVATAFWLVFWPRAAAGNPLVWLSAVPTLAVAYLAVARVETPPGLRLALYVWALAALAALGAATFPRADLDALAARGQGWQVVLAATWLGAQGAMIAQNALTLAFLIPVPFSKEQSLAERMKQVHDFARLLVANFAPSPIARTRAALVVAAQAGLILLLHALSPGRVGPGLRACVLLILAASVYVEGPEPSPALMNLSLAPPPGRVPTGGDIAREKRRRRRGR
jgi:hypothetical protein